MEQLEKELCSMQSYKAIHNVLNNIELHDLQCIDVMKMIYQKRGIAIYDTGTGKTLLASAIIKLLRNECPSRKFIMFVTKDQLLQTPKKIFDASGSTVISSSADARDLKKLYESDFLSYDVLMLTHACLGNASIMKTLFRVKDYYCGIFIDEAHLLNNVISARSASILASVTRAFEYCWALTATPIVSELAQFARLASVVDPQRYPDYRKLQHRLSSGSFKIEDDPCFFINRKGSDLGRVEHYRVLLEWVDPLPHQKVICGGSELFQLCKGEGAYPQANKLVSVILQRAMLRGLVYVEQHSVRQWILPFLDQAGIRYDCINGNTSQKDRERIMHEFNENKSLDIIVLSVTTAIDLDCDYVVFYEFTVEVQQMIGRAHRGLSEKTLDIIFIVTDDSGEGDYLLTNIVERSHLIKSVLHKELPGIDDVERGLVDQC